MLSQNIEGFSNLTHGTNPTNSGTQPTDSGTQPTISGSDPISSGFTLGINPSAQFRSLPVFPGVESENLTVDQSHDGSHDQSSANHGQEERQPISNEGMDANHSNVDLQMYQHLYNSPNLQQQDFNFG